MHEPPDTRAATGGARYTGERLELDLGPHLTRFVTAASVWLLGPDEYVRLPRHEKPRVDGPRLDPEAFRDATPIPYRDVAWQVEASVPGWRLHIIPAHQPEYSGGILTGVIESASIPIPPIPEWVHEHRKLRRHRN